MSRAVAHTSESALDATHEQALTETVDLLPAFTGAAHDTEGPPRGALYSRHEQGYASPVAHTSVPLSTLTGSLRRFMHMQPDPAARKAAGRDRVHTASTHVQKPQCPKGRNRDSGAFYYKRARATTHKCAERRCSYDTAYHCTQFTELAPRAEAATARTCRRETATVKSTPARREAASAEAQQDKLCGKK